jgi:hypothetical protein
MAHYNADLATSLLSIRHKPREDKWEVVLEVNEEMGQKIMHFAQVLSGLASWGDCGFLSGGLVLHDSAGETEAQQ